jgi:hypothetical protein
VSILRLRNIAHACTLGVAVVCAGCATVAPAPEPAPAPAPAKPAPTAPAPYVEPPPPPINLQGFPPSYRLGFGDGCSTGRGTDKRDPVRYSNDGNYRMGWTDGVALCRKK